MIREFHDEITRLREQLASMTGGKIRAKQPGGMGPGGYTEGGEQFEYVLNQDKIKEMEDQLEQEKRAISIQFEKDKAKLEKRTEMGEEERNKLI